MAAYAQSIRGDGLLRAHAALSALEEEPQRLQRARVRFDDSPPPYTSDQSGTTTRSPSPDLRTDEQRSLQERRDQLSIERAASEPYAQFEQQTAAEMQRIIEAHENRTQLVPVGHAFDTIAYDNVKQQWVEQGIWSDKWSKYARGKWKHEEPLELGSESETDSDAPTPPLPSWFRPRAKPRRKKCEEKMRRITESRRREREASRPYHQFIYQISKERERIQKEAAKENSAYTDDVNTKAYENVRSVWRRCKIWNEKWGTMPGMSWKHEQAWEEAFAGHDLQSDTVERETPVSAPDPGPRLRPFSFAISNQAQDGEPSVPAPDVTQLELGQRDEIPLPNHDNFGNPVTSLSQSGVFSKPGDIATPSIHPYHETNMAMASEHGGIEEINMNGLGNNDLRPSRNALSSPASQHQRANGRKPSDQSEQPHIVLIKALHLVRPSRVSKAKGAAGNRKRSLPTQQSQVSLEALRNEIPPSASEAIANGRPRRSARLGQSEAKQVSVTQEATSQSRPKRNVASSTQSRTSPKPRGITKRRSVRDATDKTRKKKVMRKGKT